MLTLLNDYLADSQSPHFIPRDCLKFFSSRDATHYIIARDKYSGLKFFLYMNEISYILLSAKYTYRDNAGMVTISLFNMVEANHS